MKNHIFFSPHLDDAVLSCGALIYELGRRNQNVKVINVFSGSPPPEKLSVSALGYFKECGLGTDAMKVRKKEDRRALSKLGCQSDYLDLYESLHRTDEKGRFLYAEKDEIFNDDLKNEEVFLASLTTRFTELLEAEKAAVLYIPLGIGTHIDHLLTRTAIEMCSAIKNFDLLYYEDIPYVCCLPEGVSYRPLVSNLDSLVKNFDESDMLAKFAAVLEYESQIQPLFESSEQMRFLLKSYASSFSESFYAERYWFSR